MIVGTASNKAYRTIIGRKERSCILYGTVTGRLTTVCSIIDNSGRIGTFKYHVLSAEMSRRISHLEMVHSQNCDFRRKQVGMVDTSHICEVAFRTKRRISHIQFALHIRLGTVRGIAYLCIFSRCRNHDIAVGLGYNGSHGTMVSQYEIIHSLLRITVTVHTCYETHHAVIGRKKRSCILYGTVTGRLTAINGVEDRDIRSITGQYDMLCLEISDRSYQTYIVHLIL